MALSAYNSMNLLYVQEINVSGQWNSCWASSYLEFELLKLLQTVIEIDNIAVRPVAKWNVEKALCAPANMQCTHHSKLEKSDHPSQMFQMPFKYFIQKEDGDASLGIIRMHLSILWLLLLWRPLFRRAGE